MRLLFDHNLSPRLVTRPADVFPDSAHVYSLGLDRETDDVVWNYAREQGFTIVSRDADFSDMSTLHGFPPKLVWIRRGNCSTTEIDGLLRQHSEAVQATAGDPNTGILRLF